MRLSALALLFLVGCPGPSTGETDTKDDTAPTDDTGPTGGVDADGDGYDADVDCDDGDATVHPDAEELCDGVDNDCDDVIDVTSTWYADADADGFGDPAVATDACEQPDGYVADGTDCDDTELMRSPGATEICDGLDNDCDDAVDDDAYDATTWYTDADLDGYGDDATAVLSCDGEGLVDAGGDCDDSNPFYNPAANEDDCADPNDYNCDGSVAYTDADADGFAACEECNDGDLTVNPAQIEVCNDIDDNCDGSIDEDVLLTFYADADGDGYGDDATAVVACTPPSGYVEVAGDCADADPAYNPGADESDCTDPNDYNCDGSTGYADDDADGFAACEECDDASPDVNPSATETCNEIDDDCDGTTDEDDATDAATWYADVDGDLYGDATATTLACDAPVGYVADATDCDDTVGTTSPGAAETCNDVDDDCDGTADEDATDAPLWYVDVDGDGYGDPSLVEGACDQPAGYVADGADCDDSTAAVSPAATELCNGVDDDCDGTTDEDDAADASTWYADADGDGLGDPVLSTPACSQPSGYVADATDCDDADPTAGAASDWYADADSDGYGDASVAATACEAPAGYVADASDCDDGAGSVNPAAAEVCNDVDDDCNGSVDDDATDATAWYADTDGDTYGDASVSTMACDAPAAHVADATDCDDTSAAVSPAATEACNDVDDDCDGAIDEAGATGEATWYVDVDGDGYGSVSTSAVSCDAPAGYVGNATDCDDASATVSPAATEACNDLDDDCDGSVDEAGATGESTWYADADGDTYGSASTSATSCDAPAGYVANDDDCDDASSSVSPAGTEVCNDVDDDCDGTADDSAVDASTWYRDADSDGYGNASVTTAACDLPSGYVSNGDDCDDASATASPAGTEVCNGADDDCDGTVDEDSAVDAATWYADGDGDGYGNAAVTDVACTQPSGYVSDATDCDDARSATYPGAAEYCNSIDDDCDAVTDEPDAVDATTWYVDADGDGYGDSAISQNACTQPSGYVATGGDCNDAESAESPAGTEVCEDGFDNDCSGDPTECELSGTIALSAADDEWVGSLANEYVGSCVTGGDLDDDGIADVVVGSYGYDTNSAKLNTGKAYVFTGPTSGSETISAADGQIVGSSSGDSIGYTCTIPGDLDGDGIGDLLVAGHLVNGAATDSGSAYLYHGPVTGSLGLSGADATLVSTGNADYAGYATAGAGDVDGDGRDDVLVGAYGYNDGADTDAGLVGFYYGDNVSGSETLASSADLVLTGVNASDYLGSALDGVGDVDADGLDDFVVGAYGSDSYASNAGAAYLLLGGFSATSLQASDADAVVTGAAASDRFGYSVAGIGDADGDGYAEWAVSADQANTAATDAGNVYVFDGNPGTDTADALYAARFTGVAANDFAGRVVAGAGDVNGDGTPDLLASATGNDTGASGAGAVYLIYGPFTSGSFSTADAIWYGGATSDAVGYSLTGPGDTDGDGYDDVLFGAVAYDPSAVSSGGGAWLYLGSGI